MGGLGGSVRAGLLAGCVVVGGCWAGWEFEERAPPVPTTTPSIPPPLLVASGSDVLRWENGEVTELGSVDGRARLAVEAGEAGVLVEEVPGDEVAGGRIVGPGELDRAVDTPPAERVALFDAPAVDGEGHVLYATYLEDPQPTGDVILQELGSGDRTVISPAAAVEFFVNRASFGEELIVLSAVADLTEDFSYYRPDGSEIIERPDPTDDLEYNAPPFMTQPVLGSEDERLAYLEGPDWDPESEETVGRWELVVIDQEDGDEDLRLRVDPEGETVLWLDFDGRWAVVSRTVDDESSAAGARRSTAGPDALPVLLVDTLAEDPDGRELDVRGAATIADGGR